MEEIHNIILDLDKKPEPKPEPEPVTHVLIIKIKGNETQTNTLCKILTQRIVGQVTQNVELDGFSVCADINWKPIMTVDNYHEKTTNMYFYTNNNILTDKIIQEHAKKTIIESDDVGNNIKESFDNNDNPWSISFRITRYNNFILTN